MNVEISVMWIINSIFAEENCRKYSHEFTFLGKLLIEKCSWWSFEVISIHLNQKFGWKFNKSFKISASYESDTPILLCLKEKASKSIIRFKMMWTVGMIKNYIWRTFIQWWIFDRFLHYYDHVNDIAVTLSMFLKTRNYVNMRSYLLSNISFSAKQCYSVYRKDISFHLKWYIDSFMLHFTKYNSFYKHIWKQYLEPNELSGTSDRNDKTRMQYER